ncbi:MAG TPA: hypothetical protein VGH57_04470 [Amycolatopsis sp.]|jgi:hypothetical protein
MVLEGGQVLGPPGVVIGRCGRPDPGRLVVFGGGLVARAVVTLAGVVVGWRLGSGLVRLLGLEGRPVADVVVGWTGAVAWWAGPGVRRLVAFEGGAVAGAVVGQGPESGFRRMVELEGRLVADAGVESASVVIGSRLGSGVRRQAVAGGPPVGVLVGQVGVVIGWCTGQASSSR